MLNILFLFRVHMMYVYQLVLIELNTVLKQTSIERRLVTVSIFFFLFLSTRLSAFSICSFPTVD